MSNIDYLIDRVLLFHCKNPVQYTIYDDVYVKGERKTYFHQRTVYHEQLIIAKVVDITFFGIFVKIHRSNELVNIEFNNIDRISSQYKWVFKKTYINNWKRYADNEQKKVERFTVNLDRDYVELDEDIKWGNDHPSNVESDQNK